MKSGVLTSIGSRQRSAISAAHCPKEQTLDPGSAAREPSPPPQCSPAMTHYFSITRY